MSKEKKQDAVAKQGEQLPAVPLDNMLVDAGAGFESVGASDLALPFLVILQALSPQLKRGESRIEGAEEGDIFNTVTGKFFSGTEGIYVIPCTYRKAFVEWKPREAGGGFVKQFSTDEILAETKKDARGRDILPSGNIIVTTAYHYVLLVDPVTGDYNEAVIAMSSTQLKKSRKWNSVMSSLKMPRSDGQKFTPPMFSHMYHLTTEPEKNEAGAWSGWKIELYSQVPSMELYKAAKKFALDIQKGVIREATPPVAAQPDEQVPF